MTGACNLKSQPMTLDEAIEHCEEVYLRKQNECTVNGCETEIGKSCIQCSEEHKQLAEWLTELKARRSGMEQIEKELMDKLNKSFNQRYKAFAEAIEIVRKNKE